MMGTLRKEVFNREVDVHQWTMITKLFKERDRVAGALGVNVQTGETRLYKAKAIVLAAGSAVALQKYTSANFQTTGDAYVAAFDVGRLLERSAGRWHPVWPRGPEAPDTRLRTRVQTSPLRTRPRQSGRPL
jgi:succinate dehydrogenase / fumarate reductase flavoprotein subunit